MCRSIKTLRPPYTEDATTDDVHAAALQYVRKIAGMRAPSVANREAFDAAVEEVAAATATLLSSITVKPQRAGGPAQTAQRAGGPAQTTQRAATSA